MQALKARFSDGEQGFGSYKEIREWLSCRGLNHLHAYLLTHLRIPLSGEAGAPETGPNA
jgi:hypothetical protein